jgi:hypothetical protein
MTCSSPGLRALVAVLAILVVAPPVLAQAPAAAPTTAILTTLTVKSDAALDRIMQVMPDEVRVTVQMYLDGKIQQWYARADGRGVVFILNAASVADARALTDTLPLMKAGLATFEYTALTPLTPLRLLIGAPAAR